MARFSKVEMFKEFRALRDAGETPLSTEKKILHIDEQGDEATAIFYCGISDRACPAFYELRLLRLADEWRVAGETARSDDYIRAVVAVFLIPIFPSALST